MRHYTEDELLTMSEEKANKLFESGKMDDDDLQRGYDLQDEMEAAAYDFIHYELKYYL